MTQAFENVVQTQSDERRIRLGMCVFADFRSGPLRVWDGIGDLVTVTSARGRSDVTETWLGTAGLVQVSDIDAAQGFVAGTAQVTLSPVVATEANAGLVAGLLASRSEYKGRRIVIKCQPLDPLGQPEGSAFAVFAGVMSKLNKPKSAGQHQFQLSCESPFVGRSKARAIYYTDGDQKQRHPLDNGLRFVPAASEKTIR